MRAALPLVKWQRRKQSNVNAIILWAAGIRSAGAVDVDSPKVAPNAALWEFRRTYEMMIVGGSPERSAGKLLFRACRISEGFVREINSANSGSCEQGRF